MKQKNGFLILIIALAWNLSGCNQAKVTAMDANKQPLAVAINLNPFLLLGAAYPVQVSSEEGPFIPSVEENSSLEFDIELSSPLTSEGQKAEFAFYSSDPDFLILHISEDNTGYFSYDEQKTKIFISADLAQDDNCFDQDVYLIAVDKASNIPQYIQIKTVDVDKCVYVATNGGLGYKGNFASSTLSDSSGAVEAADAICAANIPAAMSANSPTFKAMIVVSNSPSSTVRNPDLNWVFSAPNTAVRYFGREGTTYLFTLPYGANVPDLADENHLENSFGTSGTIWTGFSGTDWSIDTPIQTQCAGGSGQFVYSWNSTGATGSYGRLNAIYYNQAIVNYNTQAVPDLLSCDTRRNLLCVEQ